MMRVIFSISAREFSMTLIVGVSGSKSISKVRISFVEL